MVGANAHEVLAHSLRRLGRDVLRTHHYDGVRGQRLRLLAMATTIGAVVTAGFGMMQLAVDRESFGLVNIATATIFAAIPLLHRFGELVAPLTFIAVAYLSMSFICWHLGTATGIQFYFLIAAAGAVMVMGVNRIGLAIATGGIGIGLVIALEFTVPANTGQQPQWTIALSFVVNAISAGVMALAIVWFGLRQIASAEAAMEREYARSEALLANILPASIAQRLKEHPDGVIADRYEDASILFADIAGYTQRASETTPEELVAFLDDLYCSLDELVNRHGLEKIKTSGDAYIVVSGVPQRRPDHLEALAELALDIADTVAGLTDSRARAIPVRIGLASGPVVAGVVGSQRFFYDVWGDAVNVASRMESTASVGRIQAPQAVYERLTDHFTFVERGDVDIKGKGVMHTWYLVGRRGQGMASSDSQRTATG
ncbi:adenylate/guanylate cyclase domain-containing protein [Mycobacterium simiae]|uniref:adenylate/guanylate cyclase domain-containing protein n=1 Tax=Mycobacterium simiae TaxID=1784 RepID=UPI0020CB6158|nr:adenylate/guanylate cyclase domain-containing protein [Mycobacterium simiae]